LLGVFVYSHLYAKVTIKLTFLLISRDNRLSMYLRSFCMRCKLSEGMMRIFCG